ncbi:putative CYB2-lactate dehydrogenase cytochrome b2 [Fusarium austroafricanum]|uniref:Putative CYB2-lactate dehydrogenase cytochrome b2 n=1 Tax=Fusarium austroafricanum TaxID=2364996 RepID=A0A8H4NPF5_9HYPO|nr:putative CYB2-lactate dehydrogenase cytochrome b2 [Fusarium austroafricanum]
MTEFAPEHPGGEESILDPTTIDAAWKSQEQDTNPSVNAAIDPESRPKSKPELDEIINLNDFERVAENSLANKPWAVIHTGSNDNITRDANNTFLNRIWLRPQVMIKVGHINTRQSLFGCDFPFPIYIAPTGGSKLGGSEGELTLARAAAKTGIVQCFATPSSYPHLEILEATEKQAFFQLYVNKDRSKSEAAIREAIATGKIKALFVTVDVPVISKREEDERVTSGQTRDKKGAGFARLASSFIDPNVCWEDIKWLRSILGDIPIVVKGIQRASDAQMALAAGCDGIVISNHGGRAADGAAPSILTLLELNKVCPEVFKGMKVLIDGGFRRGSDVVKAICLGASAVGFGRPFLYSLGYGQEGVEHAINIIKDEIETAMRLCGITDLMRDAHPGYVNTRDLDHLVSGAHDNLPSRRLLPESKL